MRLEKVLLCLFFLNIKGLWWNLYTHLRLKVCLNWITCILPVIFWQLFHSTLYIWNWEKSRENLMKIFHSCYNSTPKRGNFISMVVYMHSLTIPWEVQTPLGLGKNDFLCFSAPGINMSKAVGNRQVGNLLLVTPRLWIQRLYGQPKSCIWSLWVLQSQNILWIC